MPQSLEKMLSQHTQVSKSNQIQIQYQIVSCPSRLSSQQIAEKYSIAVHQSILNSQSMFEFLAPIRRGGAHHGRGGGQQGQAGGGGPHHQAGTKPRGGHPAPQVWSSMFVSYLARKSWCFNLLPEKNPCIFKMEVLFSSSSGICDLSPMSR